MGLVGCFVFAFVFPFLFTAITYLFVVLVSIFTIDIVLLFATKKSVLGERTAPEKLSNGDENAVVITLKNRYAFTIFSKVIDEIDRRAHV